MPLMLYSTGQLQIPTAAVAHQCSALRLQIDQVGWIASAVIGEWNFIYPGG